MANNILPGPLMAVRVTFVFEFAGVGPAEIKARIERGVSLSAELLQAYRTLQVEAGEVLPVPLGPRRT